MPTFLNADFTPKEPNTSTLDWHFLFHAEFADTETGWFNYGYRYYVPTLGRWLSRDPIGKGITTPNFLKTEHFQQRPKAGLAEWTDSYPFTANQPISNCDVLGLMTPAQLVAMALLAAAYACVATQGIYVSYADLASGDRYKHCLASCRAAKTCGGVLAAVGGVEHELSEILAELVTGTFTVADLKDAIGDMQANAACMYPEEFLLPVIGGIISAACRESCADCCKRKIGYNTWGEPH
jgi:RHS repeat-associated protein